MNIFEKSSRELASNTDAKAELAHPIKWVKALALFLVLIIASTFTVNSYAITQLDFSHALLGIDSSKYKNTKNRTECLRIARKGNCEQYRKDDWRHKMCKKGTKHCTSEWRKLQLFYINAQIRINGKRRIACNLLLKKQKKSLSVTNECWKQYHELRKWLWKEKVDILKPPGRAG